MWLPSEWFGAEVKGCRKCPNTPVNNECKLDVEDCFFTAREEGGKYCGTSLCTEENSKVTLNVETWTGTNVDITCTPCNAANNEYVTNDIFNHFSRPP